MLPVTVASSSAEPSLAAVGSGAICDVATLFRTFVDAVRLGYTSKRFASGSH